MKVLSQPEKQIIKAFLEIKIPPCIREESISGWDLMECYEELFNYAHGLLNNAIIDLNMNSTGTGRAYIFEQEYKNILINLSNDKEFDLQIYCYLSLSVLSVIEKLRGRCGDRDKGTVLLSPRKKTK